MYQKEEVDFSHFDLKKKGPQSQKAAAAKDRIVLAKQRRKTILFALIIAAMVVGVFIELKYFYLPKSSPRPATQQDFRQLKPNAR